MSVINLSQAYRESGQASYLERIKMFFSLDLYSASSLAAAEDHFAKAPPLKTDPQFEQLAALLILRNLEIKTLSGNDFGLKNVSLEEIESLSLNDCPFSVIQDWTRRRIAMWASNDPDHYLENKESWGIDHKQFTRIPKVYLRYRHIEERGQFDLIDLQLNTVKPKQCKKERKKFSDLFTPDFDTLATG